MIIKIIESPKFMKKYRAIFDDGNYIDFGLKGSKTFLDHHDEKKRENYLLRHLANKREKYLIDNLIPSPALLSAYLLWNKPTLEEAVKHLNKLL